MGNRSQVAKEAVEEVGGAKMRKIFTILVLILIFLSPSTKGLGYEKNDFGLGIILGSPTGFSAKLWVSKSNAFDGAIAWAFGDKGRLQIHGDYLWHNFKLIKVETGSFPIYYGLGFRVNFGDDTEAGVRFPVGLAYLFARAPFDIFVEVVPVLQVVKETDLEIDGAIGARFFFK